LSYISVLKIVRPVPTRSSSRRTLRKTWPSISIRSILVPVHGVRSI